MALTTASFSVSQNQGSPSIINFADTSSGTDSAITQRRIILTTAYGDTIVPIGTSTSYIYWDYANNYIVVDGLKKDFVLLITVQWLNSSNVVLYTSSKVYSFTLYSKLALYKLTQIETSTSAVLLRKFYKTKFNLKMDSDNAEYAVLYGGDIINGQSALNRAALIIKTNLN